MPLLSRHRAGQRPAGSSFSRGGTASLVRASGTPDPYAGAPLWHMVDSPVGITAALGDSITFGATAKQSWFLRAIQGLATPRRVHLANLGKNSGRLYSATAELNIDTIRTTYITPVFNAMKAVFFVFAMTNDAFLDGASAATCITRLKTICTGLRASHPGCKIIVLTPLPRQANGSFETVRQAFRSTVLSGDPLWDYVADCGGDAAFIDAAASASATYFNDQIHPTDLGQLIIAGYATPCLEAAYTALAI